MWKLIINLPMIDQKSIFPLIMTEKCRLYCQTSHHFKVRHKVKLFIVNGNERKTFCMDYKRVTNIKWKIKMSKWIHEFTIQLPNRCTLHNKSVSNVVNSTRITFNVVISILCVIYNLRYYEEYDHKWANNIKKIAVRNIFFVSVHIII